MQGYFHANNKELLQKLNFQNQFTCKPQNQFCPHAKQSLPYNLTAKNHAYWMGKNVIGVVLHVMVCGITTLVICGRAKILHIRGFEDRVPNVIFIYLFWVCLFIFSDMIDVQKAYSFTCEYFSLVLIIGTFGVYACYYVF